MGDLSSDISEISDDLKEKVSLSLLKDDGKQEPCSEAAADAGTSETVNRSVPEETIASENAYPKGNNENLGTSESENKEAQMNPITVSEEKLAADESNLTEAQLEERYDQSKALKAEANTLYKESAYKLAVLKYTAALEICPLRKEKDRAVLHANRAAALMAAQEFKEALPDLQRALELDSHYIKALERRARLNRLLLNLDDSLKDYQRLLELEPKNSAYTKAIGELQDQIRVRNEELKTKMLDSLKQLGNVFLKPFGLSTDNFSMTPNEGGGYNLQMKGQQ